MDISIRGFRGCERADFHMNGGITLLAGKNFVGKSSICQALGAAFTGEAIPFFSAAKPGKAAITKTEAKELLRGGMDKGYITVVRDGAEEIRVEWPGADVKSRGNIECSKIAAGLLNPLDLSDADRQRLFSSLLESEPTFDDFLAACKDAGIGQARAGACWKELQVQGWDALAVAARSEGAVLKGKWEAFSKTKYGSKKAADWRPEGWRDELAGETVESLGTRASFAQQELERAIKAEAIAGEELERLRVAAEQESAIAAELKAAQEAYAGALGAQGAAESALRGVAAFVELTCPSCGVLLELHGANASPIPKYDLKPLDKKVTKAAKEHAARWREEYDKAKAEVERLKLAKADIQGRLSIVHGSQVAYATAKERNVSPDTVQRMRDHAAAVEADRMRVAAMAACAQIAADLNLQTALADLLAPEGLRRQKLVKAIGKFNRNTLAGLCQSADYPQISVDEELTVRYGGRSYFLLSESEKYRVRAVLTVAIALTDGSPIVILDGADILDDVGRNGLFSMLSTVTAIKFVVGMTLFNNEAAPDLKAHGMGETLWVEDGVAKALAA